MSLGAAYDRLHQLHVQCIVGPGDDSRGVAAERLSQRSKQACSSHLCLQCREASERVFQSHAALYLFACFSITEVAIQTRTALDLGCRRKGGLGARACPPDE